MAEIDIVAVERERLPGTHPGDRQQPDQRLVTRAARNGGLSLPAAAINAAISCSV
jgi:hypothetical protein